MAKYSRKRSIINLPVPRTFSHRAGASKTFKSRKNSSFSNFQKEITIKFLVMTNMIKLYHWKTYSYSTHKATDELYGKLNDNMDKFMEILLGKSGEGHRTNLTNIKNIKLNDLTSNESLKREIISFKSYLVNLDNNKAMKMMSNSDLYNIRDEILGDLNQFLYLLTLK
jgi:DNA-binding ferritin-like protein